MRACKSRVQFKSQFETTLGKQVFRCGKPVEMLQADMMVGSGVQHFDRAHLRDLGLVERDVDLTGRNLVHDNTAGLGADHADRPHRSAAHVVGLRAEDVVVLKDCVPDTKVTPSRSKISTISEKSIPFGAPAPVA